MLLSRLRARTGLAVLAASIAFTAACGEAPQRESSGGGGGSESGASAETATSAEDLGGMEALEAAAKEEGQLNVIALPPDWTNYGEMISTFSDKYGITVDSAQPDAASQDEINAAQQLKGTDRAPDVFDLGATVARANVDMFAPYQVATWDDIPEELKDPEGRHVSDYTGYMSIGYDAGAVPEPKGVEDLLGPEYKGKVALNGDPTTAGAAFNGVVMAAIDSGGSPDDIAPGVEFFKKLKAAGNFLPVDPTPATIASGQTPVVIDWDYSNAAQTQALQGKRDWKVVVPEGAVVSSYYQQAINKDAPHPAAARLWQEFLYSDEGQNIWLEGFGRPVRADAMKEAGTIDEKAFAALPQAEGEPINLTVEQEDKAKTYLGANWAKAIS
ncbi:MAG: ABC transporter, substrate-binding protein (cluster 1, maltose/g3p/polyamine/iron) [uncultured Frankineae bacterium]|uniref:ABC transporter, substrate-binding protein (Cluster 1, maltose/g3p/polyamine/iron) n=1 Tax=uncultured Frankineae bacterium TaxID=437475 RepID=A0A6J4KXX6_9ACTN|nr:MAG: ABC transporter, substrate-binding protein (cluster 1, maltose/g3p/polyamine/iron) [uncultured Frankineae bacterium]